MAYLEVNGVAVKTPSSFIPSWYDLSGSDAGRDLSGLMFANKLKVNGKIVTKITLELEWWNPSPAEVADILDAFEADEYFTVKYHDPRNANGSWTKTFYLGDRTAPVKQWFVGNERYSKLSFTIIER